MQSATYDAVIIGAGFSGIAAGRLLHHAGKRFMILEARERLGGRVYTKHFQDGLYLDLGGQWIGPTQDRMYQLVREYGLKTYTTHDSGRHQIDLGGKRKYYKGLIPRAGLPSVLSLGFVINKLEKLAKSIPLNNPAKHPKAHQYDRITLEEFVKKNTFTRHSRSIITAGLETVFACKTGEISLLHALFYIRSGTSLDCLISVKNGAQQDRIVGGMQSLAEKMTEPFNDCIRFNSPVQSVRQNGASATVSGDGFSVSAKKVIVTTPPHLTAEIDFEKGLPDDKSDSFNKIPMGLVAKCFGVYNRPFWREKGFSGLVISDERTPFQAVFDASPVDASYGILLGFCIAGRHEEFFSYPEIERKRRTLRYFSLCFGEEALNPVLYTDHSMKDEPWSGGCYAGLYTPGLWTRHGSILARPEGNIHFAGTETSEIWYGYIEGAVRAGERSAREIIDSGV